MSRYRIRNEVEAVFGGARRRLSANIIRELPSAVGDRLVAAGDAEKLPDAPAPKVSARKGGKAKAGK